LHYLSSIGGNAAEQRKKGERSEKKNREVLKKRSCTHGNGRGKVLPDIRLRENYDRFGKPAPPGGYSIEASVGGYRALIQKKKRPLRRKSPRFHQKKFDPLAGLNIGKGTLNLPTGGKKGRAWEEGASLRRHALS